MKSISNQYKDLKEGRMSQANFMRNLRMALPQYITNVTSFDDSVRILKNKGILTELGPAALQMAGDPEEEASYRANLVKRPSDEEEDDELDAFIKKLEQDEEAEQAKMSQYDESLNEIDGEYEYYASSQSGGETGSELAFNIEENTPEYFTISYKIIPNSPFLSRAASKWAGKREEEYGSETIEKDYSLSPYQRKYIEIRGTSFGPLSDSVVNMIYNDSSEDAELDSMIDKMEDEESGKYTKFQDFPGGISEAKNKKKQEHEVNPTELRMGIKVELEHTDDLDKAKKIALDHLSENPIYYTQLKLSGLDAHQGEVKKPKAAKKEKQKDELTDKENGMKPVKNIEKIKASANKAHKETNKGVSGVQEFTHSAKRAKGIKQVMEPTGGKMKPVREGFYIDQKSPSDVSKVVDILKQHGVNNSRIHSLLVSKYGLSDQEANKAINPSPLNKGIDLGASFDKFKDQLEEIVREVLNETFDGRDNLDTKNEGFEYMGDKIIMTDDTKDTILDDSELQNFITPKSFVRNKNGQTVLWIDWMEPEQFDKLANFLGIKY